MMPGRRDALQGGVREIAFPPSGTSSPTSIGLARSAPDRGSVGRACPPPGTSIPTCIGMARSAPGRESVGRACPPPGTSIPTGIGLARSAPGKGSVGRACPPPGHACRGACSEMIMLMIMLAGRVGGGGRAGPGGRKIDFLPLRISALLRAPKYLSALGYEPG